MGNLRFSAPFNLDLTEKAKILGICSLGCFIFGLNTYKAYKRSSAKFQMISEKQEMSVQECRALLKSKFEEIKRMNIEAFDSSKPHSNGHSETRQSKQESSMGYRVDLTDKEILYRGMLVKGVTCTNHPLSSLFNSERNDLLYRLNNCRLRYSNDKIKSIFSQKSLIEPVLQQYVPNFSLVDTNPEYEQIASTAVAAAQHDLSGLSASKNSTATHGQANETMRNLNTVEVLVNTHPKICQSSLNYFDERYTDRQLSRLQKFQSSFTFIFGILGAIFSSNRSFVIPKGVEVGFNEYEFGIQTGGLLSILGDVIYNIETKQVQMVNPILFIGEKSPYLKRILTRKSEKLLLTFLFFVGTIVTAYYFQREVHISPRQQLLASQANDALSSLKEAQVKQVNDMKCDTCNAADKQIVFKPCGHLCVCKRCHANSSTKSCPVCRKGISKAVEIFHA